MASGYNIYQDTLSKLKNPYQSSYSNPYDKSNLTPTQQEIRGYADIIESEKKPKMKPLALVFDLLQRGQYVTANMVDQALKNTKKDDPLMQEIGSVLKAGVQGLTGERKGNYKDILVEHAGMEDTKGKVDAVDILGFVGDVFLDPTTYVSFGASKMGVSAATKYADDVARVTLKTMKADDIAKIASKNLDIGKFNKLMSESTDKAMKYLSKQGGDASREIGKIRNLAYKEALKTPAEELRAKMLSLTSEAAQKQGQSYGDDIAKSLQKMVSGQGDSVALADKIGDITTKSDTFIEDLVSVIPESYGGAGERVGARVFGHEFGEKIRPLNSWERAKDVMGTKINDATPDRLKDIWWKFNNTGVLGEVRRKLGIRDPYGKMVNMRYMEEGNHYHMAKLREYTELAQEATGGFDDTLKDIWVRLNDKAEEKWTKKNPITAFDMLNDPATQSQFGITPENIGMLEELGTKVTGLMRKYRADYTKIAQEGLVADMNDIVNYLPMVFKDPNLKTAKYFTEMGSSKPGYTMERKASRAMAAKREALKLQKFLGISPEAANKAVRDYNMSGLNMNLDELLQLRGYAQAQVEKRANIIRTFREFGVQKKDVTKAVGDIGLGARGANINLAGLRESTEKGLEGLMFDKDVSEVFGRIVKATDPRNISKTQKKFVDFNSWWKGMATMTTGFHARNALSNNVTGWMVHGPDWFRVKPTLDANAAAIYAMKKADVKTALKEVNMSEGMYKRLLNKRYGDYSLKELADMQLKSGLLSEAQMGLDAKSAFEKIRSKSTYNPMSLDFKGRDLSQKLGGWIENSAKFKSFLIDYQDIMKGTGEMAEGVASRTSDDALKYAERKAKKWWLDYSDLCFDIKTKILTDEGWKGIDEIGYDQKALTFNIHKDQLEWKEITYIHKAGYNGPMYHLTNKGFDAMVTPNHKWVKIGGSCGGHWTLKKAKYTMEAIKDIFNKDVRLKVNSNSFEAPNKETFTDDFVKLAGWALTEGSYQRRSIQIYQSETHNPKHCKELRRLGKVYENDTSIYTEKKGQPDIMTLYVKANLGGKIMDWLPNKQLNMKFMRLLTKSQLVMLYKVLINGDGHTKRYSNGGIHETFTQKGVEFIDNFQALCMMIGRRSVSRDVGEDIYTVGVRHYEKAMYMNSITKDIEPYSGQIWSIHTDNGTVIAKREGTTYISGNTEFEKSTMKNIIPFYSWMRKNIGNQLEGILIYPQTFSLFPKVIDAMQYDDPDFNPEDIPPWMSDLGAFPVSIPGMEKGSSVFRPDMPFADLNKIPLMFEEGNWLPKIDPSELKDDIVNSLHPVVKSVASLMTSKGYDFFRKKELGDDAIAPKFVQTLVKNPKVLQTIDGLFNLAGIDSFKPNIDNNGKLRINAKWMQFFETNLPIIRNIDLIVEGGTAAMQIEEALEEASTYEDDDDKAELLFKVLGSLSGIKFYPIDKENLATEADRRLYGQAEKRRLEDKYYDPDRVQRRATTAENKANTIRRVLQ